MRGSPRRLGLKSLLRQEIAGPDRDRGGVGIEIFGELPLRHIIDKLVYGMSPPCLDHIFYFGETADDSDFRNHFRVIITQVLQTGGHIVDSALHKLRIEHHGRRAYLLPELVDAFAAAVRPVVDIQERIPAECQIAVGLLPQIRRQICGADLAVAADLYLIGCQSVLPLRHQFGGAAVRQCEQQQEYASRPFHLRLNSESVTAVATATFNDSAPPPNDGMRSRQSSNRRTSSLMPVDSLPMTTRPSASSSAA